MSPDGGEEPQIVLIRHAETEWTITHQHTGRTDIPLTDRGREAARALAATLDRHEFGLVLVSPCAGAPEKPASWPASARRASRTRICSSGTTASTTG